MARRLGLLVLAMVLLGGCRAAPEAESSRSSGPPAGMSIRAEVHVFDAATADRYAPGVYLLEPDGTLRVGPAPDRPRGIVAPPRAPYPPVLRTIGSADAERLWRLVRSSSLDDPDDPERISHDAGWAPLDGRSAVLVDISDDQGRRRYATALLGATPAATDARALVERLQALAWRTPRPSSPRRVGTP
ncbi:MAG: hypothetical protein AAFX79_01845 [Planctomycetota bacterium]